MGWVVLMKRMIVAAVAALSFSALADEWGLSQKNKDGGEIVLTYLPCKTGQGNTVYAYAASGNATLGCWTQPVNGSDIFVEWRGGKTSVYSVENFHLKRLGNERNSQQ